MIHLSRNPVHKHITINSYIRFLELAQKYDYRFISFDEVEKYKRFIILRHDIDIDLHYALRMAELEHAHHVKSTYFILLRSPLYNLFCKESVDIVQKIIKNGHSIGLHFDSGFYGSQIKSAQTLRACIKEEVNLMRKVVGKKVFFVSFHQPPQGYLARDISVRGSFESVYGARYFEAIRYIADSAGRWRYESIIELLMSKTTDKIQFLSHPALWFDYQSKILNHRLKKVLTAKQKRMCDAFKASINNYAKGVILYE